jgi:hypothetical protein
VESLHQLRFVERHENVTFLGPPGAGKTHLAIRVATETAQSGRRVHYATLAGAPLPPRDDSRQWLSHAGSALTFEENPDDVHRHRK